MRRGESICGKKNCVFQLQFDDFNKQLCTFIEHLSGRHSTKDVIIGCFMGLEKGSGPLQLAPHRSKLLHNIWSVKMKQLQHLYQDL